MKDHLSRISRERYLSSSTLVNSLDQTSVRNSWGPFRPSQTFLALTTISTFEVQDFKKTLRFYELIYQCRTCHYYSSIMVNNSCMIYSRGTIHPLYTHRKLGTSLTILVIIITVKYLICGFRTSSVCKTGSFKLSS